MRPPLRDRLCTEIEGAIRALSPNFRLDTPDRVPPAVRFALAFHTVMLLRDAARKNDAARTAEALGVWEEGGRHVGLLCAATALGPLVTASRRSLVSLPNTRFGSIPHLVGSGAVACRDPSLDDALAFLAWLVPAHLWERPLGVVVLLDRRPAEAELTSFSLAPLPGTIFLDQTASMVRTAESFLHEWTHCWLNEQLWEAPTPEGVTFWSPWKASPRPARNFLHAVAAFSEVVCFLETCLQCHSASMSRWERAYARQCARQNAKMLARVRSDFGTARAFCPEEVGNILASRLERAVSCA